jgi:hypothetical protein
MMSVGSKKRGGASNGGGGKRDTSVMEDKLRQVSLKDFEGSDGSHDVAALQKHIQEVALNVLRSQTQDGAQPDINFNAMAARETSGHINMHQGSTKVGQCSEDFLKQNALLWVLTLEVGEGKSALLESLAQAEDLVENWASTAAPGRVCRKL